MAKMKVDGTKQAGLQCSLNKPNFYPNNGKILDSPSSIRFPWLNLLRFLPIFFIAGWLVCNRFFDNDVRFLFFSVIATLCSIILVFFLHRSILVENILPIIILLTIFIVGYYVKFYWMIAYLMKNNEEILVRFFSPQISPFLYRENLLYAFELATYGYAAFCFAAILAVCLRMTSSSPRDMRFPKRVKALSHLYLASGAILLFATSLVVYHFGIGIHGSENIRLPYKLTGIIHYLRGLGPLIILLIISWTDRKGLKKYWRVGISLISLYAFSYMLVETSRGALIDVIVFPLVILWLLNGKLSKKRLYFIIILFVIVALFRPVFTAYRVIRTHYDKGLISNITQIYNYKQFVDDDSKSKLDFIYYSFVTVVKRVIGIDSVLYFTTHKDIEIDVGRIGSVMLGQENFAGRFTQEIVGYGPTVTTHFNAPSLIGGLYWLGGIAGIVFGVFSIVLISQCLWGTVCRSRWVTKQLALVIIASLVFTLGTEGTFEGVLRTVLVMLVFIIGLEFISRIKWNLR